MRAVHTTARPRVTTEKPVIAGFAATLSGVDVAGDPIALWEVADLERHVDRNALLAADDPPEPPYWAHRWTGAAVLAEAVPRGARSAVELGCGLGLPGLVRARHGAHVTFVDRVAAPLAFVRASAAANRLANVQCVVADFTTPGSPNDSTWCWRPRCCTTARRSTRSRGRSPASSPPAAEPS